MPAATSTGRARASRAIVALVLVVIALSAVVRLVDLDVFPTIVFDEHYYVHDANALLHGRIGPLAPSPWKPGHDSSLAHPPLGVMSIAAGIAALGNDPWGWRVPSALAGTALIALVYPLARRLRLTPRWALAALVLAASDTMLIAESRIGVLDPFVALWSAVCIYCALRYVQSGRPARWLALTGLAGGLAVASNWSGALALIAAIAIVALDARRRRRAAAASAAGAGRSAAGPTSGPATSGAAGAGVRPPAASRPSAARPAVCRLSGQLHSLLRGRSHTTSVAAPAGVHGDLQLGRAGLLDDGVAAAHLDLRRLSDLVPLGALDTRRRGPDRDRQSAPALGLDRRLHRSRLARRPTARCRPRRRTAAGRRALPAVARHQP